ncbi:MAG: hypothetical protein KC421_29125 [Anaerolineales bacterium]|nr:hypothetical protein [Anaerolineales bacterium]
MNTYWKQLAFLFLALFIVKLLPYGIAVGNERMITVSSRNENRIIRFQNYD